jgi:hypothetical protein
VRLYHVAFWFQASVEKQQRIDAAMSSISIDWIRYSSHSWIVYAASADKVHIAVREAIDSKDQFLVMQIDPKAEKQGLLSQWVWNWLDIDRTRPGWIEERDRVLEVLRPLPPPPQQPSLAELLSQFQLGPPPPET